MGKMETEIKEQNWFKKHKKLGVSLIIMGVIFLTWIIITVNSSINTTGNTISNTHAQNNSPSSNSLASNLPRDTNQVSQQIQQNSNSGFSCPDFSSLSDRVSCNNESCQYWIITNQGSGKVGNYKLMPIGYVSGQMITNLADMVSQCKRGSAIGENENYFYCRGMYITSVDTDSSGNIISSVNYDVTLVIDNSKIINSICTKE